MTTFFRNMTSRLLALLAVFVLAFAQSGAQAQPAYSFSQQELDQMLAPIALYPDALLSQILMAATYPLEVVEAARWSRDRPGLSGDAAVRAAETEDWDPSVKSLVAFPQVLARMDENPQWTQALGDAFLEQQSQVMDTVQALRRKAKAEGNLRSDDRVSVVESGPSLLVQPFDPRVVYVPYYDPLVVYGSWWWPAYPPVYWRPWPGYYARPGYARGFYWGPPVGISAGFFFGIIDWRQRQVKVAQVNNYYYSRSVGMNRAVIANRAPGAWRHEAERRRSMAYRSVGAQQRFGAASVPQGQGNRAEPAEPRRSDERMDLRPTARPETRSEARSDDHRPAAPPAAETRAKVQPAPASQRAAVMQTAPVAQHAPSARHEAPRAPQPRMEFRPAQSAARRETATMAVARHEPAARHYVPKASGPRAEIRSPQAAARQEPGAKLIARPRMGP
ncbi:MAG: DUF3300 domain-containing protein [Betaproteobacteria bacterium]|nr:MAG: DUF3300 domain-containing protein [Betaproteobacteria bacterium]